MKFSKKPTSLEEQLQILESRGVQIDNENAKALLHSINYYRFCGYGLSFEKFDSDGKRLDQFQEGTTFNTIYNLYLWDESLRNLFQKYLGKIEVTFRAVLNYELVSLTQNPFWYLDTVLMKKSFNLINAERDAKDILDRAVNDHELAASHFRQAYDEDPYPPCWIISEYFSFGQWSKIFGQLQSKDYQKQVAKFFKAPPDDFVSWIHALVILRNRCAHHARLWDYEFKIKPSQTSFMKKIGMDNSRVGIFAYIIHDLLSFSKVDKDAFSISFNELLKQCPMYYDNAMGLPSNFYLGQS